MAYLINAKKEFLVMKTEFGLENVELKQFIDDDELAKWYEAEKKRLEMVTSLENQKLQVAEELELMRQEAEDKKLKIKEKGLQAKRL